MFAVGSLPRTNSQVILFLFHISLGLLPRSFGLWDIISVIYFEEKKRKSRRTQNWDILPLSAAALANDVFYNNIWAVITARLIFTAIVFHCFTKSEMKMREGSKRSTDNKSPNTLTHTCKFFLDTFVAAVYSYATITSRLRPDVYSDSNRSLTASSVDTAGQITYKSHYRYISP